MNNALTVATVDQFRNTVAKDVAGLSIVTSVKTKASSIGLMKKKSFVDAFKKKNPDSTNKQATQAFDQYRVSTLRDLSAKVALQLASGGMTVERIRADGTGDIRNLQLVRRDRAAQDRAGDALRQASELTGLPIEQLLAMAKQHSPNAAIEIEAETSEVKPQGDAANDSQSNGNANGGNAQGEQAQTGPDATARENGQASGGRPPQIEEPLSTGTAPQAVAAGQ